MRQKHSGNRLGLSIWKHIASNVAVAFLLLSALCIATYMRGLFGGFLFDDYPNIVANKALHVSGTSLYQWYVAIFSSDAGLLKRPISMLSFAANYWVFGLNPIAFKAINLLVHLINGWLVFALTKRLLDQRSAMGTRESRLSADGAALLAAALWLLHPLNVSSVLYIVQRMTILSAGFTLAGLVCYAEGRLKMLSDERGFGMAAVGLIAFGTLATLSKENGVLIFPLALIIEWACFNFSTPTQASSRKLKGLFLLTVVLPAFAFLIFLAIHPGWLLNGYNNRDFTLSQRLLTEPRILWHYILWIFIPNPAWMGMYHDDIALSTGLITPNTTAVALAAWLSLVFLAIYKRRHTPALSFAIAWFLVGHAMESSAIALELTFEHRNYLPMVGLLVGLVAGLRSLPVASNPKLLSIMAVATIAACTTLTACRAATWNNPLNLAIAFAKHHPLSARSQYDAGRAIVFRATGEGHVNEGRVAARPYFQRAMELDSTSVHSAVALVLTYANGDTVPEAALDSLNFRLRNVRRFFPESPLALMNALSDQWVLIPADEVKRLVTSALDNPATNSAAHASILNAYGRYQFQVQHDTQAAISLTLAAAEQEPRNPRYRLNLANLAIALKKARLASENLVAAQALDPAGIYADERDNIENRIQELQLQSP